MAVSMLAACGNSGSTATTTKAAEDAKETTAAADKAMAETKAAVEAMSGDFSDKKVGICIYQFSDNFMSLFHNELVSYLVSKGFKEENIKVVDGANDQATQTNQIQNFITDKWMFSLLTRLTLLPQQPSPIWCSLQEFLWFTSTESRVRMKRRDGKTISGMFAM